MLVILLGQKAQRLLLLIWLLCKSKLEPHKTSNLHNSHEELRESQKHKWVPKGICMHGQTTKINTTFNLLEGHRNTQRPVNNQRPLMDDGKDHRAVSTNVFLDR